MKDYDRCSTMFSKLKLFKLIQLQANNLATETAMKQVAQYTKIVTHIVEMVGKAREEWDVDQSRSGVTQTSSMTDTQALVAAVGMGKSLKGPIAGAGPAGSMMVPPAVRSNAALPPTTSSGGQITKAAPAIKANIKSANQVHPYAR